MTIIFTQEYLGKFLIKSRAFNMNGKYLYIYGFYFLGVLFSDYYKTVNQIERSGILVLDCFSLDRFIRFCV